MEEPATYVSFSGEGTSLGAAAESQGADVDASAIDVQPLLDESKPKTQI